MADHDDKDNANDEGADDRDESESTAGDESESTAGDEERAPAKSVKASSKSPEAAVPGKPVIAKAPPPPSAGLGKSVSLFVGVVAGLSLLMIVAGGERGVAGPAAPTWKEGDTVDVDVTLVSTDRQELACASGTELKGLHCGFESQGKRWTKSDPNDDKKTLRPYSTTNGINFLGAGLWTDPGLTEGKLPTVRFAVKCKLNVAGKMPRADVRWREGESWNSVSDWFTGSVSDCKLSSVQN